MHLRSLENEPEMEVSFSGALSGLRSSPGVLHVYAKLLPNLDLGGERKHTVYLGACSVADDWTFALELAGRDPKWPWLVEVGSHFSHFAVFDSRVTCGLLLQHVGAGGTDVFYVSSDRLVKDRLTLIGLKNPSPSVAVAEFGTYDLGDITPIEQFDIGGRIQVVRDDGEVETPGKRSRWC